MKIQDHSTEVIADEFTLLARLLPLAGATVLDLGCGKAEMARRLARDGGVASVIAFEVDAIQHAANLRSEAPATLHFAAGGAEAIAWPDASCDLVTLFKSLHHVPPSAMDTALAEVARVLRPGGRAWISEPVFAGELNELVRIFHDEQAVRAQAFAAVTRAVAGGRFELLGQYFFDTPVAFRDFADFDARMIRVTHTQHDLDAATYARLERQFAGLAGPDGLRLTRPMRVDLLRKPLPG